jgi:phosphate transport system substrate-binding protein
MEKGAEAFPTLKELKGKDKAAFKKVWKSIRKDGAYVEAGENDNVIVQKLEGNKDAYGIFGYSFLEENTAKLKGVAIDGVEPAYDAISGGTYKGARPLFIYVKKQHVGVVPGMDKFVEEYVSEKAMSKDGYLARKGLVSLPKEEADKVRESAVGMKTLSSDLVN